MAELLVPQLYPAATPEATTRGTAGMVDMPARYLAVASHMPASYLAVIPRMPISITRAVAGHRYVNGEAPHGAGVNPRLAARYHGSRLSEIPGPARTPGMLPTALS